MRRKKGGVPHLGYRTGFQESGSNLMNMTSGILGNSVYAVPDPIQGYTEHTRLNSGIKLKSLQIRGIALSTYVGICTGGYILVYDRNPGTGSPAAFTDVFDQGNIFGHVNTANSDRFKVLRRKCWVFITNEVPDGTNPSVISYTDKSAYWVDDFIDLHDLPIIYESDLSTRFIGRLIFYTTGNLGWSALTPTPAMQFSMRLRYAEHDFQK